MPSKYTYRITPAATRGIDSILAYIANDLCAPKSAVALLDEIENAIKAACAFPESHTLVAEPLLALRGYRKLIVKNYLVIYSIDDREAALNIIRVVYGARDYQRDRVLNDEIRKAAKEGIVTKSIGILRRNGMPDEQVKEKMITSFSLDEETVDSLMDA